MKALLQAEVAHSVTFHCTSIHIHLPEECGIRNPYLIMFFDDDMDSNNPIIDQLRSHPLVEPSEVIVLFSTYTREHDRDPTEKEAEMLLWIKTHLK